MSGRSYVVNVDDVPTQTICMPEGHVLLTELMLDGSDGGPEAARARFSDGLESVPHFHSGAQFQVLLSGSLAFPDTILHAPAVHYTDHHVAYGPFKVIGSHEMLILHAKPAGAIMLDSKERYREIDKSGREFSQSAQHVAWEPFAAVTGARVKVLISDPEGLRAELVELPANSMLPAVVPEHGRFEVVCCGRAQAGNKELHAHGLRFVRPEAVEPPLLAGPEGVTVLLLNFDRNAIPQFAGSALGDLDTAREFGER